MNLKEPDPYPAILRKGEAREARKALLLQGRSCFGEPIPAVVCARNWSP
jgi:hypothetical protein